MRILTTILAVTTLTVVAGCAHSPKPTPLVMRGESLFFWQDKTVLLSERTIPELDTLANDSRASEMDRARAVFNLFAQHVRPGSTSVEFQSVVSITNWLRDCRLNGVYSLAGWIPVEMASGDTVFSLALFPVPSDKGSLWVVYFRLSGNLREGDAQAFLAGDAPAGSKTRMLEFALCFPHSTSPGLLPGRIERFSSRGIHVYSEWLANPSIQRTGASRSTRVRLLAQGRLAATVDAAQLRLNLARTL